jgi:hypothetical protein
MKAFNYLLLSTFIVFISLHSIAASSDADDTSVAQRASARQNNRVDRRHNRVNRRQSVWSDIKDWFKAGHQRRKSRRHNRKLNRMERREKRHGRRDGRQDNRQNRRDSRQERRDDFFD